MLITLVILRNLKHRQKILKTLYRYSEPEKQYRNWSDTSILPTTPGSADINRGGYQLLRCSQKRDPWYGIPATTIINDRVFV